MYTVFGANINSKTFYISWMKEHLEITRQPLFSSFMCYFFFIIPTKNYIIFWALLPSLCNLTSLRLWCFAACLRCLSLSYNQCSWALTLYIRDIQIRLLCFLKTKKIKQRIESLLSGDHSAMLSIADTKL